MIAAFLLMATLVSRARAQDPDEPAHDGKWLYTRNCSGCHNDNGDGRGATILQLGLTARDFKQGGFAFGDTREQMIRTVSTGIPGRSPMPSFKGVLSDEEIGLVVDYVRTLMPPRKDEKPKNTIMVVRDKPVIARGKLPPLAEGGNDIPRGLLIGTPQGMTFEYDLEGVKLLGVRLGAFADREDWHDRGGGYLMPLGKLVSQNGPETVSFEPLNEGGYLYVGRFVPTTRFRGTVLRDGRASLRFQIRDDTRPLLSIDESVETSVLSVGPGISREWLIELGDWGNDVSVFGARIQIDDASSKPWSCETLSSGSGSAMWWTRDSGNLGVEVVYARHGRDPAASMWQQLHADSGHSLRMVLLDNEQPIASLKVTRFVVPKWTAEVRDGLQKELDK